LRELFPHAQIFEAASFALLEAAVAQSPVDLVLLDLNMPGARGLSSLIYLRGERPETPVLVISANDQPRTVRRAQQFGAAGFISKAAPMQVLQQAVRAVMAGDEWFPGEKAGKSEEDARLASRLAHLTPQQFRVLLCVADGVANKQIAFQLGLAENTVKVHITAILRKLECSSRTQAAVLVKALATDEVTPPDTGDSMNLAADE
jgi:DNA-binding NarL/FixJ family response regulator